MCDPFLLSEFFEGLALEAKIDEDKPMIVKNSIHARKTLQRRAKTNKIKKTRSNSRSLYLLKLCYILSIFLGCFFVFWLICILSFEKKVFKIIPPFIILFSILQGCFFVFWLIHILSFEKRKIMLPYLFFSYRYSYSINSFSFWY